MTQRYVLHYAPDNASLIVRLALSELDVAFETTLVDRAQNAQTSATFRAINPAARIPVLETPAGPIFETAAILLWLTETHGQLAPAPQSPDRAAFLKWLFYTSNTLHANLRLNFYPSKYAGPDPTHQRALQTGARRNIIEGLDLMETLATQNHGWFNAPAPSVLDFYQCAILRWCALYPRNDTAWFSLANWPNLKTLATRVQNRPSVDMLCLAEDMAPNPFTHPSPPTPPEGSAL